MSEENIGGAEATQDVPGEEYVPKKAYEETQRDMHKYKAKAKAEAAAKAEYEAKLKAIEEERLVESQKFKELYEKTKAEAESFKHQAETDKQNYLNSVKKQALKQQLGGSIKDVYLSHANIAGIEINENGVVDQDSLLEVANSFRAEHSVLLQKADGGNATGPAAKPMTTQEKSLGDMSIAERQQLLKSMKNK